MSRAAKIIAQMRANPRDWRIEDLKTVAGHLGIDHRQPATSHVTFRHPVAGRLTVPARKPIKPVYIRQFIKLIDALGGHDEESR